MPEEKFTFQFTRPQIEVISKALNNLLWTNGSRLPEAEAKLLTSLTRKFQRRIHNFTELENRRLLESIISWVTTAPPADRPPLPYVTCKKYLDTHPTEAKTLTPQQLAEKILAEHGRELRKRLALDDIEITA